MSEILTCPLCGAEMYIESETETAVYFECPKCDYSGPPVYIYSRRNVVEIQRQQNALIAAALERARKGEE